jgi:protein SCO1/2
MPSITRRQALFAAAPVAGALLTGLGGRGLTAALANSSDQDALTTLNAHGVRTPSENALRKYSIMARGRIRETYFPNVPLITQDGEKVNFYKDLVEGKVVTFNFFYTKCEDVCPMVTANLAKVQRLLGDRVGRDIHMYSFTLSPAHDTPQVIKKYADSYSAKPGWTFLTGEPADLELLRRKLGFTNSDPALDQDKTQHIGNVRYGNEPLTLWGTCAGMVHAEWIVKEISFVIRPQDKTKA